MRLFNFKKLTNWEYWPWYMFYIPNIPYAFYLALRAKNFVFYSAANPAIKYAGNGSESKYQTSLLIPDNYKPKSIFISSNTTFEIVMDKISASAVTFPLIVKPDIGFRGLLVKKIHSENELALYLKKYSAIDLLIQEFIDLKNECGIFYHRIPGEKKGKITSVTLKKYLSVTGNGKSSLLTLIKNNERAKNYLELITELNKDNLDTIPEKNENIVLNFIGNHSKGTQFINGNHLINNDLTKLLDTIKSNIDGWFYGRIDIKYTNFSELLQGKNFKIIELNGILSEPTHIYDPTNITYFNALKEIRKHWKICYKIATVNHSKYHINYDKSGDFLKSLRKLKKYTDTIAMLSH